MTDHVEERGHRPWHPLRGLRIAGFVVMGVVGAALFALAFGWFVMLLWNWLMPAIFGLGTIGYWQAFGIVILAKLIFGSLGGGHRGPRGRSHRHGMPGRECADRGWKEEWGGDRWRYWRDYWKEEGSEAFDRFVSRKKGAAETPKQ
jgi:hypothetical protein